MRGLLRVGVTRNGAIEEIAQGVARMFAIAFAATRLAGQRNELPGEEAQPANAEGHVMIAEEGDQFIAGSVPRAMADPIDTMVTSYQPVISETGLSSRWASRRPRSSTMPESLSCA